MPRRWPAASGWPSTASAARVRQAGQVVERNRASLCALASQVTLTMEALLTPFSARPTRRCAR